MTMTGNPDGPAAGEGRPLDAEGKLTLTLRVNGRDHVVRARPQHTLLDVLRHLAFVKARIKERSGGD